MCSGEFAIRADTQAETAPSPPLSGVSSSATWTFLFTDIAGSTRLWEGAGGGGAAAMRAAVMRHEAILRGHIENNNGHFFKTVGDGVCAAFVSPRAALNAAIASQVALLEAFGTEQAAPPIFRVRIALHTGEAEKCDGDYSGSSLSRVARLLGLLHGGQIAVSETTATLLRRDSDVPQDVTLTDLGEHRLRDLTCAERVFQIGADGLPRDFPPLRSLHAQPNNLPVQLTAFLGRDNELAEVSRLLRTSGTSAVRLLTLTGPGGAGKTRLSLQAAAQVLPTFPGGAFFVDLAPLSGGALVLPAIAAAVGGGGGASAPPTSESELIARLNERAAVVSEGDDTTATLVVLDNCEHLVDDCARIADRLLRACPGLRILATSREPLGVAGETAWPVPPLPLPEADRKYSLRRLAQFTAIALFVERAKSVRPDFSLSDANAAPVTSICRHLDGIPLALELAAAYISVLSPAQIEARLSDRFRLLSGGANRTALPRQKTLRAAIDWSYDLLSVKEKILLRHLSVFAGGWTLAAAEAVCADPEEVPLGIANGERPTAREELPSFEVFDALFALVRKSLVVSDDANTSDGETRYRLLETIREYASERLRAAEEEEDAVRHRHLAHFAAWASEAAPRLREAEQTAWFARFDSEHDNVRAALAWGTGAGASDNNALRALQLAGAMLWFWRIRGHGAEGRAWLLRALETLSAGSTKAQDGAERAARIKALNGLGILASGVCDHAEANKFLTDALRLCEQDEAAKAAYGAEAASVRANLGMVASVQSNFDEAEAQLLASLRYYQTIGDDARAAWLLNNLAAVAADRGRPGDAIRLMGEGITIERRLNDHLSLATSLANLTDALRARNEPGDLARAWVASQEGLAIRLMVGDYFGIAGPLSVIGLLLLEEGQAYRAVQALGSAASAISAATTTITFDDSHEELLRAATAMARRELGGRAFDFAYDEGQRLKPQAWLTTLRGKEQV